MTTSPGLAIVGLGPAGLDRVGRAAEALVMDERRSVVVRTSRHPAAAELAESRPVVFCDDLYDTYDDFDTVYQAIAERVLESAKQGPTTYAVPGSAVVGERAVALIRDGAAEIDVDLAVIAGESFLDAALAAIGVDAVADGLQVVDGRDLPDPLPLHVPTIVSQLDSPLVASDVAVTLGKVLPDHHEITVLDRLGAPDEQIETIFLHDLAGIDTGNRVSLYVPPTSVGWIGLVHTNRLLREECPWDREQTHHSLLSHLIEETYETVDAVGDLPADAPFGEADFGAYAVVEEELGDLLLQVVFHATLARESGAFDVEEVAEGIRRKLVRRHPHVFSDVNVRDASEVLHNWEAIKQEEKGRESLMDDVPRALPGVPRAEKLQRRAASVGFDWDGPEPVYGKVEEELAELAEAADADARTDELGDLLFAVVNLARHLAVDPEIALARANDRFSERFRAMEQLVRAGPKPMRSMTLAELDGLWDLAKEATGTSS